MGNLQTNTHSQTMISNKTITIAAVGFASANALALQAKLRAQVESESIFDDIADWTVGAANDAADWTETAFTDAGNWTAGAFTDAYDWVKEGDNWEALGKTLLGATITGFKGDWEGGWDLFTDSSMYYGDTYDEIDRKKLQNVPNLSQRLDNQPHQVATTTTPWTSTTNL